MSELMPTNWLHKLFSGRRTIAKRKRQPLYRWNDQAEQLEERKVLSAAMGTEELAPAVEVSSPVIETLAAAGKHKQHAHGKAVTFPVVTGTFDLVASAVFDGDPPVVYTGTVQLSQKKGVITGNVQVTGLPLFTIKGKLNKQDVADLHGSSKFPVEISQGNFRGVKVSLDLHFNGTQTGFTGTASRTIFGYSIDVALTGTKK